MSRTKSTSIVLAVLAILISALAFVLTFNNEADAAAQAQAKKGCWDGDPNCRFMFHNPTYIQSPNFIAFGVKCGGNATVYYVFETENTGNQCPGSQGVSAVKSAVLDVNSGRYIKCWDNSQGWKYFGHLDGSWHNLSYPAGQAAVWDCHRVDAFGNPA